MQTKSTREAERKKKRNYWRRHLQKWRDSGLPQTQYCRNKNLSLKSFGYWKRKLSEKTEPPPKLVQLPAPQLFTPPLKTGSPQPAGLTLIHSQSIRIEIAEDFSSIALGKLLRTLETL